MNETTTQLNSYESAVFAAVVATIEKETGGQFGFSDDVRVDGLSRRQIAGYISQLSQKNLVTTDEDGMVMMTTAGNELAGVDYETA